MLGAIRHKGIIPWDDDIDLMVPRKDYNKLKEVASQGAFKYPYFFQSPETDQGYPKGFSRLRNSETTEIAFIDFAMNCNHGVFLDIFPLDNIPDDKKLFHRQVKQLQLLRLMMNCGARLHSDIGSEDLNSHRKILFYCFKPLFKMQILSLGKLFRYYEKIASKYDGTKCTYVGTVTFSGENQRFIYETNWLSGETIECDFEGKRIPIPEYYDAILKKSYGDYMTPVQEPTNHGDVLFSSTIPYGQFIRDHYEELKNGWYKCRKKQ